MIPDVAVFQVELPLAEVIYDLYDKLKSVTHGYGTMDYELLGYRPAAAVFPGFLAVALTGAGLLLAGQSTATVGVGLFLLGFGLASGFPILLGFLGGLCQDLTGTAFSAVFVMALVGGSSLPYLTGVLGDRQGLRASLLVVPIGLLAQGGLFLFLRRRMGTIGSPRWVATSRRSS